MGLFSKDVGIDLGTANTLVYMKGKGIIMREPSVVAVDTKTDEVRCVGAEAKAVIGRTPGSIVAVRPLKDGVIADFDITTNMLENFLKKACGNSMFSRPRVVICIPSGVTEVERRAVREATLKAGARQVSVIEEPMAAAIGAGLPPYEIKKVVTVCKAYSSAVGAGAFVSEIFGEEADELRKRGGDGGEFGATTGRPRRMGWFDCVASKYGCRLQGATDVAFTVLDVLGYLDEIPVCTGYEIDGEVTTEFPTTVQLEKAKPVIEKLPGWKCDIRGIKNYEDLPENCRKYIEFIEEKIGYPITMVSNGPGRNDIIYRNK